jgi:hypothetical protein
MDTMWHWPSASVKAPDHAGTRGRNRVILCFFAL